jgi:hypothetical protein
VRRAAVELLGKYIASAPTYAARYYPAIVERLTDVGVSVRKAVMGILREMVRAGDIRMNAPAAQEAPDMVRNKPLHHFSIKSVRIFSSAFSVIHAFETC